MFKKLIISLTVLAIANNNANCTHANLRPNEFNISPLTQEEFANLTEEHRECPICMIGMSMELTDENPENRLPYKANCEQAALHVFHKECIMGVLNDRCPICRTIIREPMAPNWFKLVQDGDIDSVQTLITNNIDINRQSDTGKTALIYALGWGHDNIARLLISNGANVNIQDNLGKTALMFVSDGEHEDIARLLINNGVDVNIQDNLGYTALMLAIWNNDENIVKLLIDNGADINIRNNRGRTALMLARNKGYRNIIRLLTEYVPR